MDRLRDRVAIVTGAAMGLGRAQAELIAREGGARAGGVRLFAKSATLHCAKAGHGIRVNSVHSGYIWTPIVEHYLEQQGDLEAGRNALNAMHPVGQVGEPDDIAYGVLYLASDESKFVTGTELVIDGGYTAQ